MKNLILNFEEMGTKKDAATKAISKAFAKAGAAVAQAEVVGGTKRTSGISYREMRLTFSDSQSVTLMVKQSGDIYQVKINGKITPIKNQDSHQDAANEIAQKLEASRTAFQKRLAAIRVELPQGVKTAAPKMEELLKQKDAQLDEAIDEVRQEIKKIDEQAG